MLANSIWPSLESRFLSRLRKSWSSSLVMRMMLSLFDLRAGQSSLRRVRQKGRGKRTDFCTMLAANSRSSSRSRISASVR